MKLKLVSVGNSKGLRLPKAVLKQAGLVDEVEVEVTSGKLTVRPAGPRAGWREAIAAAGPPPKLWEDQDLHSMTEWEKGEWTW